MMNNRLRRLYNKDGVIIILKTLKIIQNKEQDY